MSDLVATALAGPLFSPTRRPPGNRALEQCRSRIARCQADRHRHRTGSAHRDFRRRRRQAARPRGRARRWKDWQLDSISAQEVSLSGPAGTRTLEPKPDANLVRPAPPAAAAPGQPQAGVKASAAPAGAPGQPAAATSPVRPCCLALERADASTKSSRSRRARQRSRAGCCGRVPGAAAVTPSNRADAAAKASRSRRVDAISSGPKNGPSDAERTASSQHQDLARLKEGNCVATAHGSRASNYLRLLLPEAGGNLLRPDARSWQTGSTNHTEGGVVMSRSCLSQYSAGRGKRFFSVLVTTLFGAVAALLTSGAAIAACSGPGAPAASSPVVCLSAVAIPGNPLTSFDISFVNPSRSEYYLADRSNFGIDVISTATTPPTFVKNNRRLRRLHSRGYGQYVRYEQIRTRRCRRAWEMALCRRRQQYS